MRIHHGGVKTLRHPVVGELSVAFDAMALSSDPGLTLTAYSAEPGSPSADAMRLLSSWAAVGSARETDTAA